MSVTHKDINILTRKATVALPETAFRYNSSGTRAAREYYYTTGSTSYNNGTFTVTAGNGSFAANQTYRLIYVY